MRDGPERGLEELTDKEKEALRLLLAGHDTKSSAVQLGLSVHTVNDRLRSARRKLGVTSSREAARILGDAEGGAPQFPAPTQLGMAETADGTAISTPSKTAGLSTRTLAWLAGGLAMIALITAAMLTLNPLMEAEPAEPVAQTEVTPSSAQDARSESAALAWLAMADAGEWEESWEAAADMFQSEVTAAQWAAAASDVRSPLGEVVSREVLAIQQTADLPGVPEGDYTVIQFATAFAASPSSVETVIMRAEDGDLKTVGYFIR